jgi:hypothetical protein
MENSHCQLVSQNDITVGWYLLNFLWSFHDFWMKFFDTSFTKKRMELNELCFALKICVCCLRPKNHYFSLDLSLVLSYLFAPLISMFIKGFLAPRLSELIALFIFPFLMKCFCSGYSNSLLNNINRFSSKFAFCRNEQLECIESGESKCKNDEKIKYLCWQLLSRVS